MSQVFEFRALSGLHEGAFCEVFHGATIGTDPGCDIVLADEGLGARSAQVCVDASGWHLADETGGVGTEPACGFNQPLRLGPVWITVARPGDPWPAAPMDDGAAGHGMAMSADLEAASAHDATADRFPAAPAAATDAPATSTLPGAAPARRKRRTWPVAVGLFTVVLSVLLAITLALVPGPGGTQPAGPDTGRMAVQQSIERIATVIERLGLSSRVQVSLSDNGLATVSGWVRNGAEQDELATALAQIWPMPAMRVSNEADIIRIAQSALSAFPVKYEVLSRGDGQLDVRGIAAGPADRDAALEALHSQAPGMAIAHVDIRLAPDVSEAFAALLREAQIHEVSLDWQRDRLAAVPGRMGLSQRQRLASIAAAFNADHLGVVEVVLPAVPEVADSVPFGIRSVVGGEQAYLVLSDGTKLLPGGVYRNYRLLSIEADRILFDGEQRAQVAR